AGPVRSARTAPARSPQARRLQTVARTLRTTRSAMPQERRAGYEQFHPGPSPADHDSLESKRPRLEQVSDSHFQRVSAAVLPLVHTLPE
ncbi:hypothetical protein EI555_006668, partial [Monodon monoceros]